MVFWKIVSDGVSRADFYKEMADAGKPNPNLTDYLDWVEKISLDIKDKPLFFWPKCRELLQSGKFLNEEPLRRSDRIKLLGDFVNSFLDAWKVADPETIINNVPMQTDAEKLLVYLRELRQIVVNLYLGSDLDLYDIVASLRDFPGGDKVSPEQCKAMVLRELRGYNGIRNKNVSVLAINGGYAIPLGYLSKNKRNIIGVPSGEFKIIFEGKDNPKDVLVSGFALGFFRSDKGHSVPDVFLHGWISRNGTWNHYMVNDEKWALVGLAFDGHSVLLRHVDSNFLVAIPLHLFPKEPNNRFQEFIRRVEEEFGLVDITPKSGFDVRSKLEISEESLEKMRAIVTDLGFAWNDDELRTVLRVFNSSAYSMKDIDLSRIRTLIDRLSQSPEIANPNLNAVLIGLSTMISEGRLAEPMTVAEINEAMAKAFS